jgi:hypothetical protein
MRAHGLAAMAGLFALGVVGGRARAARPPATRSGASEAWRPAIGWAHAGLGVAAVALGLVHARGAAEERRKERASATEPGARAPSAHPHRAI